MKSRKNANSNYTVPSNEGPQAIFGAGALVLFIRDATDNAGPRFNVFRADASTGQVTQQFVASDVPDLVRLTHVLALHFSNEDCLDPEFRDDLACLASCLGELTGYTGPVVAERQ